MLLFISILTFCAFCTNLVLFFLNTDKKKFQIRDFVMLITTFVLTICVVALKDMAVKCTDPCPEYEKVTESFYRLKE